MMDPPPLFHSSNSLSPPHPTFDHSKPKWTQDVNTSPLRALYRTTPIPTLIRLLL